MIADQCFSHWFHYFLPGCRLIPLLHFRKSSLGFSHQAGCFQRCAS
jgi:hypothetical protein